MPDIVEVSYRRPKKPEAKKKTKVDLWREYGLERPAKPRYSGLRGIVWHLLSLYVRKVRDKDFPCINCGQFKEEYQGGHFIPTGKCGWDGMALDPLNVHAECGFCNFREKTKLLYAKHLDERYGPGTAQKLRDRYYEYTKSNEKNWGQARYRQEIAHYQALLENLR